MGRSEVIEKEYVRIDGRR